MCSNKLFVPAGTFPHDNAGEVPSPGAAPGAAWLNFTGMIVPSAKAFVLRVIGAGVVCALLKKAVLINSAEIKNIFFMFGLCLKYEEQISNYIDSFSLKPVK